MTELTRTEASRQRIVMSLHDILFSYSRRGDQSEYLREELDAMTAIGVFDAEEEAFWLRQLERANELVSNEHFAEADTRQRAREYLASIEPESTGWQYGYDSAEYVYGLGRILSHRELSKLEQERHKDDEEYEAQEPDFVPLVCDRLIPGSPQYHYGVAVTAIECCEKSVVFHWHGIVAEWVKSGRLNGNEIELTDDLGTRYSWEARPFHADLEVELLGSTAFTPAVPAGATELTLRARDVTISWSLGEK
jgi:hypothetical protein